MMKGLITHAKIFNGPAPGIDTDILSSNVNLKEDGALRISIALTTASIVNLMVDDGTTTHALGLNASVELSAGDLFSFSVAATKLDSTGTVLNYNLQVETDSVIEYLIVQEAQLGTP